MSAHRCPLLRRLGPGRVSSATRRPDGATHLLLHGVGGAQPVCQRYVRIVCVIACLRNQVGHAGRIAGGHGGVDVLGSGAEVRSKQVRPRNRYRCSGGFRVVICQVCGASVGAWRLGWRKHCDGMVPRWGISGAKPSMKSKTNNYKVQCLA